MSVVQVVTVKTVDSGENVDSVKTVDSEDSVKSEELDSVKKWTVY